MPSSHADGIDRFVLSTRERDHFHHINAGPIQGRLLGGFPLMTTLTTILLAWVATGIQPMWPSFLGSGASVIEPASIPLKWTPEENIAWSVRTAGYGQSSPVIFNDRVFVTSVEGPMKDQLIVSCCQLAGGDLLWSKSFDTSHPVENGTFVSRAAPTPVVDAEAVYCFFESGDVQALSHSGEVLWQVSLSEKYGLFENKYGLAASPVLTGDRILLLIDHPGPSYVIALDKRTGEQIWKTDRASRGSWSSPMLLEVAGKPQLLCSSAGTIDGYDPGTGELLWTHSGVGGNRICSPFVFGDGLFLVGAQTSREFSDTESVKKSNFAMRIVAENNTLVPRIEWHNKKMTPGMASPIVHDGFAYWINRSGAVLCLDAASGEIQYTERIRQSSWATPLGLGDHIYFFGKDGLTTVISSGSEFQTVSENQLWDPDSVKPDQSVIERETDPRRRAAAAMHATPEVMGVACVTGSLVIRTGQQLFCVRHSKSD